MLLLSTPSGAALNISKRPFAPLVEKLKLPENFPSTTVSVPWAMTPDTSSMSLNDTLDNLEVPLSELPLVIKLFFAGVYTVILPSVEVLQALDSGTDSI